MKTFREIWEEFLICKETFTSISDQEIIPIMQETLQEYCYAKLEARKPMCSSTPIKIDWDTEIDLEDIYVKGLVYNDVLSKVTGTKYTFGNYNKILRDFEDQYCTLPLSGFINDMPDSWRLEEKVEHILYDMREQGSVLLISGKHIPWISDDRTIRVKYVPEWKSNQKEYENQYILNETVHYQEGELQEILEAKVKDIYGITENLVKTACNSYLETENTYTSKAVMDTFVKIMDKLKRIETLLETKSNCKCQSINEGMQETQGSTCSGMIAVYNADGHPSWVPEEEYFKTEDPSCFNPVFGETTCKTEEDNGVQIESDDYNSDNIDRKEEDDYFKKLEEAEKKTHSLEFSQFKKMLGKCFFKCYNPVSPQTFLNYDKKFSTRLTGIFVNFTSSNSIDCCGNIVGIQQFPTVWIPNLMNLLIALKVKYEDMRKQYINGTWIYSIDTKVFKGKTLEDIVLQLLIDDYIDNDMAQKYLQI